MEAQAGGSNELYGMCSWCMKSDADKNLRKCKNCK